MKTKRTGGWRAMGAAAVLALGLAGGAPSGADAAGLLLADGGFGGAMEIVEHDVRVTINNGIAVTRVTQVFHNKEARPVEALYTFPVPKGASVANFSMWIGGKEMVGEVVEKERAREIYNSYKPKKRDPGLLEQVDYRTFEMRVFPVAPNGDQRVQIVYYQELDTDHDWFTYVYPLATVTRREADSRTSGKFAISVEAKSAVPLAALESPSHGEQFVVARHTPEYMQASLESRGGRLDRDVVVAGRLARPRTGLDLVTSKLPGEDGFFQLTLTAGEDFGKLDSGADYVFVLDSSGSMADDGKLVISRESTEAFLRALGAEDRFEVIAFNVQPNPLFSGLQKVSTQAVERAGQFLAGQTPRGGTVLNTAITTAYKYGDPDRALNVVILSDGLTESGERQELLRLIAARPRHARVFCVGVGNDVNRPLLEQLAEESGGLAAFLSRGDNFERQAQAFRRKLTRPAASNLKIEIKGASVYDLEPAVLPDLYFGSPVRLYGRYKGGGKAQVEVSAEVRGQPFRQRAELELPAEDRGNPEIERMWAWKRVDRLLKLADRSGARAEAKGEIVALGEGYSIVTEFTSFLVLENDAEYQRWKIDRRNLDRTGRDRAAQEKRQAELDALRAKATAELGPQAVERAQEQAPAAQAPSAAPAASPANSAPAPTSRSSHGVDLNFGTGPVGPLFVAFAAWLNRRRRNA